MTFRTWGRVVDRRRFHRPSRCPVLLGHQRHVAFVVCSPKRAVTLRSRVQHGDGSILHRVQLI